MKGSQGTQRPRIELEPELEIQVIGADAKVVLSMARTYYRWSKQLFAKFRISFPEQAAQLDERRQQAAALRRARRSGGYRRR